MQKNYRLLSPGEEIFSGDEYYSPRRACWLPASEFTIFGNNPQFPVRREIPPAKKIDFTYNLLPSGAETIDGDEYWSDARDCWLPVPPGVDVPLPTRRKVSTGEVSDGYHTFNELYRHRCLLFCMALIGADESFKASKHADGSEWDGWFIAGMKLPAGWITYHLPDSMWSLCPVPDVAMAPEWDGHTSNDVCDRMQHFLSLPISESETLPK